MRVLIFVLAILGVALVSAAPKNGQRIVGGGPAPVGRYPFMTNLQYNLWNILWMQYCGGSLLTTTMVLTAAHCVYGDTPGQWRARLGSNLANGGSIHQVGAIVMHPQYNNTNLDSDVAIMRLATPAVYSELVRGATLAGPNVYIPDGMTVFTIGWGALYSGGPSADVLQHVDMNVINQELCAERYAYLKTQPGYQNWPDITDGMICTGILNVGGKDACQGDSGGPVVLEPYPDVLVGVTSWGFGCADPFYPGVNARVSHYTNWITSLPA